MRLTCPGCGCIGNIEAFVVTETGKRIARMIAAFPEPIVPLILGYIALFRPSPKMLILPKIERLVIELKALVTASHIQWDRHVARPATAAIWAEALRRISTNPPRRLPLKSHGYLTAMAYDLADEVDRKTETARNQTERTGQFRTGGKVAEPAQISVEEMRKITAKKRSKVEGKSEN